MIAYYGFIILKLLKTAINIIGKIIMAPKECHNNNLDSIFIVIEVMRKVVFVHVVGY